MSVSLNANLRFPSIRFCNSKPYYGSKIRCQSFSGMEGEESKSQLFSGVRKSLQLRSHNPTRERVKMMATRQTLVYCYPDDSEPFFMDLWNVFYRERVIFIGSYITDSLANYLLATILYLDSVHEKRLHFLVMSDGGDITPALQLYDTLLSLRNKKSTRCIARARDLAGLFMTGGDKGWRFAGPEALISLGPPEGRARGQADEVQSEARELSRVTNYIFNEISKNTGQPIEKVTEDLREPQLFQAAEAAEYGIIDKVVRGLSVTESSNEVWEDVRKNPRRLKDMTYKERVAYYRKHGSQFLYA